MNYDEIANEITTNAATLRDEVATLSELFTKTRFLGDNRSFPHAHYGYFMASMGQIDLMSKCEWGPTKEPRGNQTPRMQGFMERYLDGQKSGEHRVAIKLFRHTLMHTGALRPLWEANGTAYTWRVYFTDNLPLPYGHYTLTDEDAAVHQEFFASINANVTRVKALNVRLKDFSADIYQSAINYTTAMRQDAALRSNCELVYPTLRAQELT
ncbi:hypothetical protein [Mycobacterium kubicae]|uniref:hypothetical protein n=1 Tax=Mycobacterium kubicae TaxID=120959 RepID=UPI0007FDAC3D|nr:hypothetical protein [Mycobacterium kubicae]OBK42078.1 hypothetical protein A5657_08040 [Mycobacterium kubicae]